MSQKYFRFFIFGDYETYTFLKTSECPEYEHKCCHFFQALYGGHLGFSKWRLCLFKTGYILASKYHILMILVSKHTFWGSGNQMQWSRIVFIALFGGHLGFFFQNGDCFFFKIAKFQLVIIIYSWFWFLDICFQRQEVKCIDLEYSPILLLAAILDFQNGGMLFLSGNLLYFIF